MVAHTDLMGDANKRAKSTADDFDDQNKWWDSYPLESFNRRARPRDAYRSYVGGVYDQAKGTARAASANRHTFDMTRSLATTPIRRSASYSSLSPSHMLDYTERTVDRVIPTYSSYKTKPANWYQVAKTERVSRVPYFLPTFSPHIEKRKDLDTPDKYEMKRSASTGPGNWPRFYYPYGWEAGRWKGYTIMEPLMYRNYDRVEERPYMNYVGSTRSIRWPWRNQWTEEALNISPKHVTYVW